MPVGSTEEREHLEIQGNNGLGGAYGFIESMNGKRLMIERGIMGDQYQSARLPAFKCGNSSRGGSMPFYGTHESPIAICLHHHVS